jgi:hypothetical protein
MRWERRSTSTAIRLGSRDEDRVRTDRGAGDEGEDCAENWDPGMVGGARSTVPGPSIWQADQSHHPITCICPSTIDECQACSVTSSTTLEHSVR